jgi:hypothetical protein
VTFKERLAWGLALAVGIILMTGLIVLEHWRSHRLVFLQGAIVVQDTDVRKQLPIPGVQVSAIGESSTESVTSDASGFFQIRVPKGMRRGQRVDLEFRHPDYKPLSDVEFVSDKQYIIRMMPRSAPISNQPATNIGNVTIRYSVKTMTEANIGMAATTFQVENTPNILCKNQHPCSPDGRWKAALGSASLDAGVGNIFRDVRISCIAGPCPFTRIESQKSSQGGRVLSVTARGWSDTATFLVEAEVFRTMRTQTARQFYPAIFGKGLSFTLPAAVEGVTIEADVDKQTIFFPLGPSLLLSWANCDASVNPDQTKVYRCELKPGYRFQNQ